MQADKPTRYFVLFQALGDNLISLYLLSQLIGRGKIVVFGTAHTKRVAELMGVEEHFEIDVVFEDIPAFYDLRKKGLLNAMKDVLFFRRHLKKRQPEAIVFEKKDFRAALLAYGLPDVQSGGSIHQAYLDRQVLFGRSMTGSAHLKAAVKPGETVCRVLIAPTSRLRAKNIRNGDLETLLALLHAEKIDVTLVDYTQEYSAFRERVETYRADTTLDEVKTMLLEHDLLIGADSFLIHLAYYFEKPFFALYNSPNLDFLPPGAELIGNYAVSDGSEHIGRIIGQKFKTLGVIA